MHRSLGSGGVLSIIGRQSDEVGSNGLGVIGVHHSEDNGGQESSDSLLSRSGFRLSELEGAGCIILGPGQQRQRMGHQRQIYRPSKKRR